MNIEIFAARQRCKMELLFWRESSRCMMFILDTNIISELFKKYPDHAVVEFLKATPRSDLAVTWSTIAEIAFGIELQRGGSPPRANEIQVWFQSLLDGPEAFPYVPPSPEVAELRGRMAAVPSLKRFLVTSDSAKHPCMGEDLTMAAYSIRLNAPVVTRNVRDFLMIDRYFALPGIVCPCPADYASDATSDQLGRLIPFPKK